MTNNTIHFSGTKQSRRGWLGTGLAAALACKAANAQSSQSSARPDIAVFTKHVQELSYRELGRRLQTIGVQGVEATLRPDGQIEPQNLRDELPAYCEALAEFGQRVIIAASNINAVSESSEAYLRQLQRNGISFLRMAYYKYDFRQPLLPQLEMFARQASEFSQLCAAYNVTALYQNHAGRNYVGAALWDLRDVLRSISPKHLAVALDIRHTCLELSQSYQAGYEAIKAHTGATYVKDFAWRNGNPVNVPLGQGRARPLFELIKQDGFPGPLSLHMEYTDHRDPQQTEPSWQAIAADVAELDRWLS